MTVVDNRSEPRELVFARQGLSWSQRRAAIRAAGRGRTVHDPAVAAFVVALSRDALRRRASAGTGQRYLAAAFDVVSFAVFAVAVDRGGLNAGSVLLGVVALILFWSLIRGVYQTERWQRAEARNRDALTGMGQAFVEDEVLVARDRPPGWRIAELVVVQWVITDLAYGAMSRAFDGRSLGVDRILAAGAIFATVLTAATLINMLFPKWRSWLPKRSADQASRQSGKRSKQPR